MIFTAISVMELCHPCAIVSVPHVANIGMGMHGLMSSETPFRSNLSHVLSWKMSLLLLMLNDSLDPMSGIKCHQGKHFISSEFRKMVENVKW